MLEIETKYAVADLAVLESRLKALGAECVETRQDADHYYNAPDRDFAKTGEAFRLRRIGERNYMTYKGPKIEVETKTRTEVEIEMTSGQSTAAEALQLLGYLHYRPVAVVHKKRRIYRQTRGKFIVDVSLDELDSVGCFAEVEIMAPQSDFVEAKRELLRMAADLGLTQVEPKSYLEMVLAAHPNQKG